MKIKILVLLYGLVAGVLCAQGEKGATPLSPPSGSRGGGGATRAVVVGISDYQDPGIPDLRFADRDAEAFANFLRSPAGGGLDGDHLTVLTNERATAGGVAAALDALLEWTKADDRVIIYFSGHGDVERKTVSQPGFLLCWDAPGAVYMGGGTYPLAYLQEIIATLSTQNKAKVVVITDACHAGKLAGSQIGGAQLTAANLARQFANEVKILSCQPNEYSIEGEQWGGGRGAFSYHLVNGLLGLADRNEDELVSLSEIDRYLEDYVASDVAPLAQTPMIVGDKNTRLARTDRQILADLKRIKSGELPVFKPVENRGLEEEVLARVDTTLQELYRLFKNALEQKVFLEPANACADAYYERLIAEPKLDHLHSTLRRNYAAALQDDAQQALNAYLKADSLEMVDRYKHDSKYTAYPMFLKRAAELLGSKHYMYHSLHARRLYFEGLSLRMQSTNLGRRDTLYRMALDKQRQALAMEENAPFIVQEIGQLHLYLRNYEEALAWFEKAGQIVPRWIIPVLEASRTYTYYVHNHPQALLYARTAIRLDSTNLDACLTLARAFHYGGKADSAEAVYQQILRQWPDNYQSFWFTAMFYKMTERTDACKKVLNTGIERFPEKAILFFEMGRLYQYVEGNGEMAKMYYFKSLGLDSTNLTNYQLLAQIYIQQVNPDSALLIAQKGLQRDPDHFGLVAQIARLYEEYGDVENATVYYQKAIVLNPNYYYAYFRLGWIRRERFWDFAGAKAYWLRSSALSPWWGCDGLAEIYFREGQPDSALLVLERGSNAEPTWVEGLFWVGQCYRLHGYFDKALNEHRKILALNPNSLVGLENMALTHEIMGNLDTALAFARMLVEHNPKYEGGYTLLSNIYRKKGKTKEAVNTLTGGLPKTTGIDLSFMLAQLLWQSGDTGQAMLYFRQIVGTGARTPPENFMVCMANFRLGNSDALIPCSREEISPKRHARQDKYTYLGYACLYALLDDATLSLKWLEKAFENGFRDFQLVKEDFYLTSIQSIPEFKILLNQYFPWQAKQ